MIITRSPLRISLGGGGTDIPSYYENYGGFVLSAAIDKYVYVTVTKPFYPGIFLKYSENEHVTDLEKIKHPLIREALKQFCSKDCQIEITSLADIPSGTGLGSSGSFTTALLKALSLHFKYSIDTQTLAELACEIEIDRLREPVGKQDQFISAYGGITEFLFQEDGKVEVLRLSLPEQIWHGLEDRLMLFFTGQSRSASVILEDQVKKSLIGDREMIKNLHDTKELGYRAKVAILNGDLDLFGEIMNEHWNRKKDRTSSISNTFISEAYNQALKNGALGGKLVGAGGGGFLLFLSNDREKLKHKMNSLGLQEVRFKFDFEGTKAIIS